MTKLRQVKFYELPNMSKFSTANKLYYLRSITYNSGG